MRGLNNNQKFDLLQSAFQINCHKNNTIKISNRTEIIFGLQGLSELEFAYKDMERNDNSFKRKTYVLQIQNRTKYFGYTVWASTGFSVDELRYSDTRRAIENFGEL